MDTSFFEALCERVEPVAVSPLREEFLAMVDAHGGAVMGVLKRLCRNSHDAEDVFQDTAVRVWRNFANRPRLRNPKAWLIKIAYRAFLDLHAKRRVHEPFIESEDAHSQDPLKQTERADDLRQMHGAVAGLPESMREVIVLHYTGGLTLRQTADVLGISTGTVKSRLNTGLAKLRSVLE